MIHIILVGTQDIGNIGAIARLMDNFGFSKLMFIEPSCNPLDLEALKRAKHAKGIIEEAPLVTRDVLDQFDILIGTTTRKGKDSNLLRVHTYPRELAGYLAGLSCENHIGIIFGPENSGLDNNILSRCDSTCCIPADKGYSSLNLSHAVGIMLYELYIAGKTPDNRIISYERKNAILTTISDCLDNVGTMDCIKENQMILWRRILGRSGLRDSEADVAIGFFRKIREKTARQIPQ